MEKPDLYIVARFLDIMFSNGSSMKKTNIQMLLGVNYPRFMEYLEWLLKRDLVAASLDEEGTERIKLTPKGIDSYHRLVDWIKETLDGVKI
jgi:predicted transcriptional regulator